MIRGSDVTVVIPTVAGREDLLTRALDSVAAQIVPPGAVVVQEDRERRGAAWARNAALERVGTSWVAWLDDDDELLPNHVKVLVRAANQTGADLVYSYAEFVGGPDPLSSVDPQGRFAPNPVNVPWSSYADLWLRTRGNFIPVTYLVRADLVRQVGGFPEPYSFEHPQNDCEDLGLLLLLLDAGALFYHVPGVRTWRYHVWEGNLGGRGAGRMHELCRSPARTLVEAVELLRNERHEVAHLPCPHGDPACPCQDGDLCHYEDDPATGTKAWPCPHCGTVQEEAAR